MEVLSDFMFSKKRYLILVVFFSFVLESCKHSNTDLEETSGYPIQQLTDSIQFQFQDLINANFKNSDSGMAALAVFLTKDNSVFVDTTYFFSNHNNPLPDGETIFQMGSVTKTFTAALISRQVNLGKMNLNDPAQNYLPNPEKFRTPILPKFIKNGKSTSISLGNLTTMSSGLFRNVEVNPLTRTTPYLYAFDTISNLDLLYKPGSECNLYSNLGFGIAGLIVSHQAFPNLPNYYDYYESTVVLSLLKPMGMNNTSIYLNPTQKAKLAPPYGRNGYRSTYKNANWPMNLAAGGLYSTLNDMRKYAKNMIGEGDYLTDQVIDTLLAKRGNTWTQICKVSSDAFSSYQAMAWVINEDMENSKGTPFYRYSKDGGLSGFSTYITFSKPYIDGYQYKAYAVLWVNKQGFPVQKNTPKVMQSLYNLVPKK